MRLVFKCIHISRVRDVEKIIKNFEGIGLSPENLSQMFGLTKTDIKDMINFSKALHRAMEIPGPVKKL